MAKAQPQSVIPIERIAAQIYLIRGQKVMLDADLATLYGVETRVLNQAVTRNDERFLDDFMFRLSWDEYESLRSQNVILEGGGRDSVPQVPRSRPLELAPNIGTTSKRLLAALPSSAKRYNLGIMMVGSTISHDKLGEGRVGNVSGIRYLLQRNIPQSACLGGNHSNAKTGS